ncbi:unnamed protein product, partial [Durusdinium trenchii]
MEGFMSVSVEIPGEGRFDVPLEIGTTKALLLWLHETWPERPWHGNKLLSCGLRQFQPDDVIDAATALVLTNYSEISKKAACDLPDAAERGITLPQLQLLVDFAAKMANKWCETTGDHAGSPLEFKTFNFYHANVWIIKPATEGYNQTGCSLVEILNEEVQRPSWFVSHAWIEPMCQFWWCLQKHALIRELPNTMAYWICASANNQHDLGEELRTGDRAFRRAMLMCEGVLLVLDSVGTPFERCWCCFEVSMAIDLQESQGSGRRLLLDVGVTDAYDQVHVLTDGLAGAERRMLGTVGRHQKSLRERDFPVDLLLRGLRVKIEEAQATQMSDKDWILKNLPTFQRDYADKMLASHFALASWSGLIQNGRSTDMLAEAVHGDLSRKVIQLSFIGCLLLCDSDLELLIHHLPAHLRILRLDLSFSGLQTLDCLSAPPLSSLKELNLRFTGAEHLWSVKGLEAALQEMEKLAYLELWFMNLPHLKELPLLFPKSLCHLDELIFVLHGCNEVSLEMRIEMNASIQSLKRYRGRHLETWVTIEHLPVAHSERGRCCRMLRSMSSRCLHSFRRRLRQHAYISASSFPKPILLGRSTATSSDESCEDTSSDESCEDTETEVTGHDNMRAHAVGDYVDETKPFPCSYAGCKFFHDAESGYCSKHRWFGVCMKAFALLSALRQYVELASLVHRAALLNALRQYVELASLVHTLATVRFGWYYKMFFLLAVGLYYSSWSAEVRVMVLLAMIFLVPLLLLLWACTASARINRMREISMELEVQTEAVYAKNLRTGLPMFFSWPRNTDIVQPHVSSLQEHYLHARRQLEQFNRELCLPLREFLEDQGCQSYQFLGPALKSILLAHEAVMKHGDPARILDLLHCDVTFDDWHSMVQAWSFLKTRVETDELSGIQIV